MKQLQTKITKALAKYGLSENEIKVYLEALNHEETSPYQISKATGVPRTTVYDVLMGLSLKGLIELNQSDGFEKQQTRIKAKNPSVMRKLIHKKRKDLTALEVDVVEILPFLKGDYHKKDSNADFSFYPGIEGAKKVLFSEEMIGLDVDAFVFDNLMPMDAFGSKEINKDVDAYLESRSKSKGKVRELVQLNDWTKHVVGYQFARDARYIVDRDIRLLDNPLLEISLRLSVKGQRIYISCAHEEEVWGLIVKSNSLSSTLKSLFMVLWTQATPITKDVVESWGENEYRQVEVGKKKSLARK